MQATWTKVSTPSLLTSLYPSSHGVVDFSDRLPASAITLAEILRGAGYSTLQLSSVIFVGKFTNLHQGFEEVHESASLPDPETSKTAREYVDRLLPWIESHRDVPFFVLLHVTDPHDPYEPYPPYNALWADPDHREEHLRRREKVREKISDPLLRRFVQPTREEILRAGVDPDDYITYERAWYDGSIRAMDVEIGRLVERLRNLGLDRKTLVVFTSDHGEEFLEHGRTFHGQSVYGELTNVPLLLWRPGSVPAGMVIEETVEVIDLMPTVLQMAGLPMPAGMQGRSLLPLMAGAAGSGGEAGISAGAAWAAGDGPRSRPAFAEKNALEETGGPPPRDTESYTIFSGDWKLIHNVKRPPGQPEFELYDHQVDPLNQRNLASGHPDIVRRLAAGLAAWREMAREARLPSEAHSQEMSPEEIERLRNLGYIQ